MQLGILFLAVALSAGNAELEQTVREGAITLSVAQAKQSILKAAIPEGALKEAMIADVAHCVKPAEAKSVCEKVYREASKKQIAQKLERIANQLNLDESPVLVLTDEDQRALTAQFEQRFATERREACAVQASQLAMTIRPDAAEFETIDENRLKALMVDRIAACQKEPVFEENRVYIEQTIVPSILESAHKERRRQGDYLRRARTDAWSAQAIRSDLFPRLRENVMTRQSRTVPIECWDIFPSVTNRVIEKVIEDRQTHLLRKSVEDFVYEPDLVAWEKSAQEDRAAWRDSAAARERVQMAESARILSGAMTVAVDFAPEAERADLARELPRFLSTQALTSVVEGRLERNFQPAWREFREALREKELAKLYPALMDRTWFATPELAESVTERRDYAKIFEDWRALELPNVNDDRLILQETDQAVGQKLKALFDLARVAIVEQMKLVDVVQPQIFSDVKMRHDSFWRRTPDAKAIIRQMTDAVLERWLADKSSILWTENDLPENAAEQYAELFPSVKKRIEMMAVEILEKVEEKAEPEPQPEEQPPEDEDWMISLKRGDNGALAIEMKKGENAVKTWSVRSGRQLRKAMEQVSNLLTKEMNLSD